MEDRYICTRLVLEKVVFKSADSSEERLPLNVSRPWSSVQVFKIDLLPNCNVIPELPSGQLTCDHDHEVRFNPNTHYLKQFFNGKTGPNRNTNF